MIKLLGNRVLIEPLMEETASGFVIPEEYRSFRVGIVKSVGNGQRIKYGKRRSIPCKVGDKVVLDDQFRMPIEIDGKGYFLVSDEKVMAILP